jgi:formiminoglutamase
MDFQQLYSFVSGRPDTISSGSFENLHIVYPGTDKKDFDAVLLGLPDDDSGIGFLTANVIRNQLVKLSGLSRNITLLDLGNITPGKTFDETNERLKVIFNILLDYEAKIILLGGSAIYHKISANSFISNNIPLNQVWIDSLITWDHFVIDPLSSNFKETLRNAPINYINIGYQSYFVEKEILDFISDSSFEAYRLGMVRNKISDFEPVLRDANLIDISLNAVKFSDAPGAKKNSPNGLTGDELCQLAFYSGYSNRTRVIAILDIIPANDNRNITSALAAQVIWYVLEGISLTIFEDPELTPDVFSKYHIHIDMANQNLAFYKSNLTNRWWMEIELEGKKRSVILSCSEKDYELACKQEIPDRWWRLFNRV